MIKSLDSKLTPFGGLHLIHKQLRLKKLAHFIDNELGSRVKTVGYNYSDILMTRIYTSFCGGSATEDVNYIRENTLCQLKNFTVPLNPQINYNKTVDSFLKLVFHNFLCGLKFSPK